MCFKENGRILKLTEILQLDIIFLKREFIVFFISSHISLETFFVLKFIFYFSESNFVKMKVSQKFSNWTKENWVIPEIQQEIHANSEINSNDNNKKFINEKSKKKNYLREILSAIILLPKS